MNKAIGVYYVTQPIAGHKEGEELKLTPEQAEAMKDFVREATPEDLDDSPEGEDTDNPDMADEETECMGKRLNTLVESKATEIAQKVVEKTKATNNFRSPMPAQPKQEVFSRFGDFAMACLEAYRGGNNPIKPTHSKSVQAQNKLDAHDADLRRKFPSLSVKTPYGANEGTNSQGGYFLKPEWYKEIWQHVQDYPDLLSKTERITISGNQFNVNEVSENSLSDGNRHGGVLGYWVSEAATLTVTYPALTQRTINLQTMVVFSAATNILLQDANIEGFEKRLAKNAALELRWQENQAVVNGSGSGQPKGILNTDSLVTVSKSTNDSNSVPSIGLDDIGNMWRSLYMPCRKRAVWLVTPEMIDALDRLSFTTALGTATSFPAFNGLTYNAADPFQYRMKGAPVIECHNLSQYGALGDIILCDLSQLMTIEHPGIQMDVSPHFKFNTMETCFRFVQRYGIDSPWKSAVTSVDGNYSYSPFVVLQARHT